MVGRDGFNRSEEFLAIGVNRLFLNISSMAARCNVQCI